MPRSTSEREYRSLVEQLEHAHDVWREHGMIPGGADEPKVWVLLDSYRGLQWGIDGWGGIPADQCMVVNSIFSVINTEIAQLNARHPVVDVLATDQGISRNARVQEIVVNHLIRSHRIRFKREVNRTLYNALLPGMGLLQHGYTPSIETFSKDGELIELYDPAKPDFPWVRSRLPWEYRLDCRAETFDPDGTCRWVAFQQLMTMEEFDANPSLIHRDDLKATMEWDSRRNRPPKMLDDRSPDWKSMVEVWHLYDKTERKWCSLAPCCKDLVRPWADWPIAWPHLPYSFLGFNTQLDDPFPLSPAEMIWQQQVERNKCRTMMAELMKRLRRVIFVNDEALNEQDAKRLFNEIGPELIEFIRTKNGADPRVVMAQVNVGGGIGELLMYDAKIEDDIRETLGQSRLDRAQRINVETAQEASAVQAGSAAQRGRNAVPWEDFLSDAVAMFGAALQQRATQEILIPITGIRDARFLAGAEAASLFGQDRLKVTPDQIQGEFIYEIRPGSTLPRNANEEIGKALQWTKIAQEFPEQVNDRQALTNLAIAMDHDPAQVLRTLQEQAVTKGMMAEQAARGVEPPSLPGRGIDPSVFLRGNGRAAS